MRRDRRQCAASPKERRQEFSTDDALCCDSSQVMQAVEGNFPRFGNFSRLGGSQTLTFTTNGPLQAGSSVGINLRLGFLYNYNTSVTVQSANAQSMTFTTVPGHMLYPAQISFSASQASSTAINFNIYLVGNFVNAQSRIGYYAGGSNFENAQWNHFLGQVSSFCQGGH